MTEGDATLEMPGQTRLPSHAGTMTTLCEAGGSGLAHALTIMPHTSSPPIQLTPTPCIVPSAWHNHSTYLSRQLGSAAGRQYAVPPLLPEVPAAAHHTALGRQSGFKVCKCFADFTATGRLALRSAQGLSNCSSTPQCCNCNAFEVRGS